MDIILASASPRRSELLKQIGIPFTVQVSNVEEKLIAGLSPEEWVQRIALQKANKVASSLQSGLVIGADTIVVLDKQILGKPHDTEDAFNMLSILSDKTHQVMTGIALVNSDDKTYYHDVEITTVKFRQLTEKEIKAYIAGGEPMDKAGAYGIQGLGALLVEGIVGCYFNVVGLPLNKLVQGLKTFGVEVLNDGS